MVEETLRLKKMLAYEREVYKQGFRSIAGIDEAGRGPLAGPVVAAACVLPKGLTIAQMNDSKMLTRAVRKQLFARLTEDPKIAHGIGIVEAAEIDILNIYQATVKAMQMAVRALKELPDYLLVDGMPLEVDGIPSLKIIEGDRLSHSIAAASVIAKETRDRIMEGYDEQWPYGFAKHKGYGTKEHLEWIKKLGPCPIHRRSFEPIKSYKISE